MVPTVSSADQTHTSQAKMAGGLGSSSPLVLSVHRIVATVTGAAWTGYYVFILPLTRFLSLSLSSFMCSRFFAPTVHPVCALAQIAYLVLCQRRRFVSFRRAAIP